jgi:hypothetical protein
VRPPQFLKIYSLTIETLALFYKIKNSWADMSEQKKKIVQVGLTIKVKKAIVQQRQDMNALPVPNEYKDTLDDLIDDPDFQEAIVSEYVISIQC